MSGSAGWSKPIVAAWETGEDFVVVHGGGPQIDKALTSQGITAEFRDGLRVTTEATMDIVEKTLTGEVLRKVVKDLVANGANPVGLTGLDSKLIQAKFMDFSKYGFVGEVTAISPGILELLLSKKFLPVISPIGVDESGKSLNINADTAAGAIAGAMKADEIIFMTDVTGIYRDWPDKSSLIHHISASELGKLKFEGGMVPKVAAVLNAITSGAKAARVIDGTEPAALESALNGVGGTLVLP